MPTSPLEMTTEEFEEYMREIREIENSHSWVYGSRDVWCAFCNASKGTREGMERCRAFT